MYIKHQTPKGLYNLKTATLKKRKVKLIMLKCLALNHEMGCRRTNIF